MRLTGPKRAKGRPLDPLDDPVDQEYGLPIEPMKPEYVPWNNSGNSPRRNSKPKAKGHRPPRCRRKSKRDKDFHASGKWR